MTSDDEGVGDDTEGHDGADDGDVEDDGADHDGAVEEDIGAGVSFLQSGQT